CHETKIDPLKSSEFGAFIKLKADSGEFKGISAPVRSDFINITFYQCECQQLFLKVFLKLYL
ncbi:hypothetical protein, partial [Bacillus licheniformis]|uniref:hypothetical protein n=1 Tax=Bacillus licheniformis TaxID=1402 RepID=UPI001C9B1574